VAQWFDPTPENIANYAKWCADRPREVREVCKQFVPWELYKLKDTGHRVIVHAISQHKDENGDPTGKISLVVDVLGKFNFLAMERRVFGIKPEQLEPCDLPEKNELLGSLEIPIELFVKGKLKEGEDGDE
jgi:hypothetical protein